MSLAQYCQRLSIAINARANAQRTYSVPLPLSASQLPSLAFAHCPHPWSCAHCSLALKLSKDSVFSRSTSLGTTRETHECAFQSWKFSATVSILLCSLDRVLLISQHLPVLLFAGLKPMCDAQLLWKPGKAHVRTLRRFLRSIRTLMTSSIVASFCFEMDGDLVGQTRCRRARERAVIWSVRFSGRELDDSFYELLPVKQERLNTNLFSRTHSLDLQTIHRFCPPTLGHTRAF